jgi:hypothetical protein
MKTLSIIFAILVFTTVSAFANEVTLLKRTIQITPQKFLRYWKNPKAAEPIYNANSWYPNVKFDVLGPIESGSKIYVEIDKANGSPWLTIKMDTPTLEDDIWETIKPERIDSEAEEKLASIESGTFNFRIKMKNALSGANTVLFSGKLKVNQLSLNQIIPENKGKKEFAVDYDWHLPLGYVWVNPEVNEEVPHISAQVCLKGKAEESDIEGYLFYNGKQISKSFAYNKNVLTSGADEPHHRYTIMQFDFMNARAFNKNTTMNDFSGNFFLDKNKGNYEIRILRKNQPSRNISFTVGSDGKIVDNGTAKSVNLGGLRMIFPTKISGTLDGMFNSNALQMDGIFGNKLIGF